MRFCKFGHHVFGSFGFTELKSRKHYPWCCTRQTSAIQQKPGSSTIAGRCHSWRSSSDRYLVALLTTPPLLSSMDISWILYFSNIVIKTIAITVIFFVEGGFTAFFFSSPGHVIFESHLNSDSRNVMIFLSYAKKNKNKNISLWQSFVKMSSEECF